MNDIMKRLKALETRRNARYGVLYPDDSDGFISALVGDTEREIYAHKGGYDALAVLNATAAQDWKEGIE